MATPSWLKRLDDLFRPVYKNLAKAKLVEKGFPPEIADQIIKIDPNYGKNDDLAKEVRELKKEIKQQELVINKLIDLCIDNNVRPDYNLQLEIMEALDNA